MTPKGIPMKPNTIKTRFTYQFLRALKKLPNPKRRSMVKLAADASMASAVGPRRDWSRAVLRKVQSRRRLVIRKRRGGERKKVGNGLGGGGSGGGRTEELRRLVPGGGAMDFYKLLDETAHYIKCLNTQVQVMRNIVNLCST